MVGSWSGTAAAEAVKQEMNERINREIGYVREQLSEIKEMIRER
jgi:hypothetical protein